ncbi:MAG: single-stranded-DNA-specific exonuclease RecJ [Chloroflexota bacterium]|jgi:single-stranded-DNA-specific exonuclease
MSRPETLQAKRWQIAPPIPYELKQETAHRHWALVQALYNRGITGQREIDAFLDRRYLGQTDPFLLPDMDRAVNRIREAVEADETIVVYGDFDADGVTSSVLLVEALRGLGIPRQKAFAYIPDRVDEGYGLNKEALQTLKAKGADLVITVDCGIRALPEIEEAGRLGLDMIVTDHHSLGPQLPRAVATINPKRPDSSYPERYLAGVGIAYKLAQALKSAFGERANFQERDLLDLVALGTVADLAPLLNENRQLVIDGLQILNERRRLGVRALADVAGLEKTAITSEAISFALAPRINAAGRLSHAYDAAKLLAVNNSIMARDFADELNQLNRERQLLTRQLCLKAEEMIDPQQPLLFAIDQSFKSGVVGLVASRLADQFYRPAIVVEWGDGESRGSCRSIPEFHITEALDQVAGLLERHGGHAQAAGFTIRNQNLAQFEREIMALAAAQIDVDELTPAIPIDAELPIGDVDWALFDILQKLEPTGYANPAPTFASRDVQVYNHRAVGHDGSHLQLWVGDGRVKLGCIAFRQGAWAGRLPDRIDLAYTISVNEWNGRRDLQLVVQDIQIPE